MTPDRKQLVKTWVAALLWIGLIAIESTDWLSAEHTSRILYPLLHFLFGTDPFRFEHVHFFIRKGGHVFGYGLLSLLLYRAWRETLRLPGSANWTLRWANLAVLGTMLVASLDEYHQSFNPERTGSVRDVILDTCAGITVQILLFLWFTLSKSRASRR